MTVILKVSSYGDVVIGSKLNFSCSGSPQQAYVHSDPGHTSLTQNPLKFSYIEGVTTTTTWCSSHPQSLAAVAWIANTISAEPVRKSMEIAIPTTCSPLQNLFQPPPRSSSRPPVPVVLASWFSDVFRFSCDFPLNWREPASRRRRRLIPDYFEGVYTGFYDLRCRWWVLWQSVGLLNYLSVSILYSYWLFIVV